MGCCKDPWRSLLLALALGSLSFLEKCDGVSSLEPLDFIHQEMIRVLLRL